MKEPSDIIRRLTRAEAAIAAQREVIDLILGWIAESDVDNLEAMAGHLEDRENDLAEILGSADPKVEAMRSIRTRFVTIASLTRRLLDVPVEAVPIAAPADLPWRRWRAAGDQE